MIKRYVEFITEAQEESEEAVGVKSMDPENYSEIQEDVKSMIEKTIETSGGEYKTFIDSFIQNPEDVKVEGFINDSDIYEFYLKFRNDIDELLNNIKYFNEVPGESNTFGLYDYIIHGTEKAVSEIVKEL